MPVRRSVLGSPPFDLRTSSRSRPNDSQSVTSIARSPRRGTHSMLIHASLRKHAGAAARPHGIRIHTLVDRCGLGAFQLCSVLILCGLAFCLGAHSSLAATLLEVITQRRSPALGQVVHHGSEFGTVSMASWHAVVMAIPWPSDWNCCGRFAC
mmetsp:Transcript_69187/g.129130  ORF Transcript_69187/g.129130 Transcript_69187/m.129130 type:complete len:153 (+) Transcript_69187:131-589(+)